MADFAFQFLWGAAVLAAFVGWGWAAGRLAGDGDADWGLCAGRGMAVVVAVGGALAVLGLAGQTAVLALVLGGVALLAARRKARATGDGAAGGTPYSGGEKGLIAVAVLVLGLRYGSVVSHQAMSCSDDAVVYFTYVTRLLQTGTLIEPFGFRRLAGFGGHSFLQSMVMVAGPETMGHLLDRGIAVVVAFGLVLGMFPGPGRERVLGWVAAMALVVVLPIPVLNSSSHYTGMALLLTLFRSLERLPDDGAAGPGVWWLLGAVAAGAASLKAHFVAAAAVTVAVWWLMSAAKRGRMPSSLVTLGHIAAAALVCLAPWMALMHLSSGTVLYPLFAGNLATGYQAIYSGERGLGEHLASLLALVTNPRLSLLLVPLVFYAVRRGPAAGLALYMGALTVVIGVAATLAFDTVDQLHRFTAPGLNAAFMATMATLLRDQRRDLVARGQTAMLRLGDGLVMAAVLLAPVTVNNDLPRLGAGLALKPMSDERRADYARMQAAVPQGVKVLAIVDQPFALDYRRNAIFNIDVPGAASLPPGMPYFAGPAAVKTYLSGLGIRHIVYRDFAARGGCLYRRDLWRAQAAGGNPMWAAHARYYLDLMDSVDALAETGHVLHRAGGLMAIALR